MPKRIWNGEGELQADEVAFTKMRGEIVGRPYVRARVVQYLATHGRHFTAEERQACVERTVGNDSWLRPKNWMLVSAVCREALDDLYSHTN
jgi:hypothetical protein